ncbi:MAG: BspA family leucine-rich repeat surface protein [Ruminococcus sp.]|nr:BspA family leucine-rich repeat surface protein [Ruminococcus sp.]
MKKTFRRTAAILLAMSVIGMGMPNTGVLVPETSRTITAHAESSNVEYDEETKTLTLKAGAVPRDVSKYKDALHIVAEEGAILPSSCELLFLGMNVITIDLSKAYSSNVEKTDRMFSHCSELKSVDLSNFDTSNVTDMSFMFDDCSSLESLDLSSFDTSEVFNMDDMFYGCRSLKRIDLSSFNTSKLNSAQCMFMNCESLESLDLSSFDTSKLTDMGGMFYNCSSLTSLDLSNFDTSNVINMYGMFDGCSSLTSLDLSSFDTSNIINMVEMFRNCSSLASLDLSSFDTSKVEDMHSMFEGCSAMTSLNIDSFTFTEEQNTRNMFKGCPEEIIPDMFKARYRFLAGDADCDGNVKMNDAVLVMQSISNPDKYSADGTADTKITETGMTNANVHDRETSTLTPMDTLLIQQYLLGQVKEL